MTADHGQRRADGLDPEEHVDRYVPPALRALHARVDLAARALPGDVQREVFALVDEAYTAGVTAGRPYVSVDPAMRSGQPCVNGTRLPVESVGENMWAGDSIELVCDAYDITRPDALVACWYLGTYGEPRWRRRWGAWARQVHGELWHSRYEVPDPPGREGTVTP